MKQKSISALQLLAGLLVFIAAGANGPGVSGIVQQLDIFGPKQWLSLIAGSLVPAAPHDVIAPLKARFAATRHPAPSAASLDADYRSGNA